MPDYIPPERDPAVHPGAVELRRLRHAARAWAALPVQGDDDGHRVEVSELIELEEAVAAVLSTRYVAEVAPQHPADVLEWVTTGPGGDDHRATVNALRRMAEEASMRREDEDLEVAQLDALPSRPHGAILLDAAGPYLMRFADVPVGWEVTGDLPSEEEPRWRTMERPGDTGALVLARRPATPGT